MSSTKQKPFKKVCYVDDLTEEEKSQVNKVCNSGFPKGSNLYSQDKHDYNMYDFLSSMKKPGKKAS